MKTKLVIAICLALFLSGQVLAAEQTTQGTTVKKHHIKKRKAKKKLKYVAPSKAGLDTENIPFVGPISIEVITALSNGSVSDAVRELRTETPSFKSLHLLREMEMLVEFQKNRKVPKLDRSRFLQNIGVAYHDLFLFLKRHNVTNKDFYKLALKYYKKALRNTSPSERTELNILIASLYASNDELEPAQKTFVAVDVTTVTTSYLGLEYLAAYYSAIGDTKGAVEALDSAYELNRKEIGIWVAISDDFIRIENEPEFKEALTNWKP